MSSTGEAPVSSSRVWGFLSVSTWLVPNGKALLVRTFRMSQMLVYSNSREEGIEMNERMK